MRQQSFVTNDFEKYRKKARKKRKLFPADDSAKKVVYLEIQQASKKMDHANPELEGSPESFYD